MFDSLTVLLFTTGSIGFLHSIMGPDHYIPFIVMSRSGQWSNKKTILITILCGFGHIISSVALALIVILLGQTIINLELIESIRGMIASWALISFGLVYMIWGIKKSVKNKQHIHPHLHSDGIKHIHEHNHRGNHSHIHEKESPGNTVPWILFLIFIFGPCEPVIPLIIYPALNGSVFDTILVIITFTAVTLITMVGIVLISLFGINLLPYKKVERYTHAIAGFSILLCGLTIQFFGL